MSHEHLWGLASFPYTKEDDYQAGAVRALYSVKDTFQEDLDKLLVVIKEGATLPEMRSAVEAAEIIKNTMHALDLAIHRVLHGKEEDNE